jgi:hypothetical protein
MIFPFLKLTLIYTSNVSFPTSATMFFSPCFSTSTRCPQCRHANAHYARQRNSHCECSSHDLLSSAFRTKVNIFSLLAAVNSDSIACVTLLESGILTGLLTFCLPLVLLSYPGDARTPSGAALGSLAMLGDAGFRSHPRSEPNTRLNPNVSLKWLRATLGGIKGLGRSSAVVHADKNSATAAADSHRPTRSIRTNGKTQAM